MQCISQHFENLFRSYVPIEPHFFHSRAQEKLGPEMLFIQRTLIIFSVGFIYEDIVKNGGPAVSDYCKLKTRWEHA